MAIRLGHVHDGHMVNLRADNIKLKGRAARIVSEISGVEMPEAGRLVDAAEGSVKAAILLAPAKLLISPAMADVDDQSSNVLGLARSSSSKASRRNSSRKAAKVWQQIHQTQTPSFVYAK